MGVPKKKSRSIIVDHLLYRYIITGNDDFIDLIIELENQNCQRLTVSFDYHSQIEKGITKSGESYTSLFQRNQITPGVVKQVIQYGIMNGWNPSQKGKEIRINSIDDNINLNLKNIM